MKFESVTMVRIYLTEADHKVWKLIEKLHDQERLRGLTVFRGIIGFGRSGRIHTYRIVDMSSDLPLVMEFFDSPARVDEIVQHLETTVEPGHLVTWSAQVNSE